MGYNMYTEEEINSKIVEANNKEQKAVLTGHLLARLILRKDEGQYPKERYIEALTFTLCFIHQHYSNDKDEKHLFILSASMEIEKVALELKLNYANVDPIRFFLKRSRVIFEELIKMNQDSSYLIPILMYNLYLNPFNQETNTAKEIMQKVDNFELIENSMWFKTIYPDFIKILRQALLLFRND